jgi:tetratricopeptide (TPR) repeat protein
MHTITMRGITHSRTHFRTHLRTVAFSLAIFGTAPALRSQQPTQQSSGRDRWADSARGLIEAGTQQRNIAQLENAHAILDRALTAFPNDPLLLHYLGYALYREGVFASTDPKLKDKTESLLDSAAAALDRSAAGLPLPETFALQSAVYGQMIGLSANPMTAMQLGPKAAAAMDRALELGPHNPRVWLMRGIGAMFTPSMFGGGVDRAEQYLAESVSFYNADKPAPPLPAWGRAEAYIWLGQAYAKAGKQDSAHVAFERATELEPANGWARQLLSSTGQGRPDVNAPHIQ